MFHFSFFFIWTEHSKVIPAHFVCPNFRWVSHLHRDNARSNQLQTHWVDLANILAGHILVMKNARLVLCPCSVMISGQTCGPDVVHEALSVQAVPLAPGWTLAGLVSTLRCLSWAVAWALQQASLKHGRKTGGSAWPVGCCIWDSLSVS